MDALQREFLAARPIAVVGASADRAKYGNIVYRYLRGRGWLVFAVNHRAGTIEDDLAYPSLAACPETPALAVLVVPPAEGLKVVDEARAAGVGRLWLQPGAESPEILARADQLGLRVIHDACIMIMAARAGHDA
ncbi:MAG: CoA-binding protein [bacterium]|nr:CoA-binding protein [bacterium]